MTTYKLNDLFGSFWSGVFQAPEQISALLSGYNMLQKQTDINFNEAFNALSRKTVPVFHTETAYGLTLLASSRTIQPWDTTLGLNQEYIPGKTGQERSVYVYPLPIGVMAAPSIVDRLVKPGTVLTNGIDYLLDLDQRTIAFINDPFNNTQFNILPKHNQAGVLQDQSVTLWCLNVQLDQQIPYNQFGYVVGFNNISSQTYVDLINAAWELYQYGPTYGPLNQFIAAALQVPLALTDGEVVEVITANDKYQQVITNRQVYNLPLESTITVSVGDSLTAYQSLCNAFQLMELTENSDISVLPGLTLDSGLLAAEIPGPLTFENKTYPVVYFTNDDEQLELRFPIVGKAKAINAFWKLVQQRSLSSGKTLVQRLDQRLNPIGLPLVDYLPQTINPLQFILSQVLHYNLFIIELNSNLVTNLQDGLNNLQRLKPFLLPQQSYIISLKLTVPVTALDLGAQTQLLPTVGPETIARPEADVLCLTTAPDTMVYRPDDWPVGLTPIVVYDPPPEEQYPLLVQNNFIILADGTLKIVDE